MPTAAVLVVVVMHFFLDKIGLFELFWKIMLFLMGFLSMTLFQTIFILSSHYYVFFDSAEYNIFLLFRFIAT